MRTARIGLISIVIYSASTIFLFNPVFLLRLSPPNIAQLDQSGLYADIGFCILFP